MKISVITATFNRAHIIQDVIESVLKQTYNDYEYIVVDGASQDNTVEILKEYEPKFCGRMRWISEKDKGMYDAINKGIRMATGDIVGIINSDDFFHRTDTLSLINKAFESNEQIEAIHGDVRVVNPENIDYTIRYSSRNYWNPSWFRIGIMPNHPTFYTYRRNFEAYGYYKLGYKIASDFELLVRHLYVNKVKTKYINSDFLTMRTGGKSMSGLKSTLLLNKEIIKACKENGIWTCLPLVYSKYLIKIQELIFRRNR